MKKLRNQGQLIIAVLTIMMFSCQSGPYPGYDKTDNGLFYKISRGDSDKPMPQEGDVLTLDMSYYLHEKDSLLFTSFGSNNPIMLPVSKSFFKGDLNEGLFMITEGDSASFIVKADSFLIYYFNIIELPDFVNEESMLRFEIKVLNHKTASEYMEEMKLRNQQMEEMYGELKKQEIIDREKWLADNNIKVKPTASGLYFIEERAGNGAKVEHGDLVMAHYTGYLLDGQVFDSSVGAPEPFSFVAGRGEVIPGWDEAVLLMKVGGKARIILPSELAYGESHPDIPIPPFATLIFDIEVIDVEKSKGK